MDRAIAIRNKILVERINRYNFVTRFNAKVILFFPLPSMEAAPDRSRDIRGKHFCLAVY